MTLSAPTVLSQSQNTDQNSDQNINQIAPSDKAQGFTVAPIIDEVEAVPGQTYQLEYSIANYSVKDKLETKVTIETFREGSIKGSSEIIPFTKENDYSFWLNVPESQEFDFNKVTKTTYQLSVPTDAKSGAYFFAIVYEPVNQVSQEEAEKPQLKLKTRIAALLFVNIKGDDAKQPVIENFKATSRVIDPFFDTLTLKYDIKVKGNSFYRPVGNIFYIEQNDEISVLSSIVSDNILLPNGKRGYEECYGQTLFKKDCKSSSIDFPWFGTRTFELRLDYTDGNGDPKSTSAKQEVIFFPYKTALIIVLIGLIPTLLYFVINRSSILSKIKK